MRRIRPARPDDVQDIRAVLAAAYAPFVTTIPDLPDVTAFHVDQLETSSVWVALLDDRVLGVAMADLRETTAHLANVAVAPEAAGRGLGRALIYTVAAWARKEGADRIDLATHPEMAGNIEMYEHLGWRVTERSGHKVTLTRPL